MFKRTAFLACLHRRQPGTRGSLKRFCRAQTTQEGSMFDDPRDMNRDLNARDPYQQPYSNLSDGSGWGAPIALLAVVIIIGALIAFAPTSNQQTASNQPAPTRSAPAPAPTPMTPPPTTAPSK